MTPHIIPLRAGDKLAIWGHDPISPEIGIVYPDFLDKFIVLSDCHRGDGSAGDEFARNSLIYKCALEYYLKEGFTYIELGDAEELWENEDFEQIYITHTSVYDLLRRFHDSDPAKTRYLKVWGNHDEDWKDDPAPLRALFPGIQVHEAIVIRGIEGHDLNSQNSGSCTSISPVSPFIPPILLLHGHQADPSCTGTLAKISRFLVRRFWSGLQQFGIGDPTRAAENPGLCDEIDATLYHMGKSGDTQLRKYGDMTQIRQNLGSQLRGHNPNSQNSVLCPRNFNLIVIAGHTHRPVYENLSLTERRCLETGVGTPGVRRKEKADPVYYNTGSCVHPRCITGIEIEIGGHDQNSQEIEGHDPNSQNSGSCPSISGTQISPEIGIVSPNFNSQNFPIRPRFTLVKWGFCAEAPHYPLAIARTVLESG